VTQGSFQVNGITIDVAADDTVNAVLDKITQSEAGATAQFDAGTESIVLTQNTPGSAHTILLENDTSGFLAAMKLDSATPDTGLDEDAARLLSVAPRFASVQSGTIYVNGTPIAIDVNTDSLNDILERINASEAGASAVLDPTGQRVSITSTQSGTQLVLDSGGTQFFQALEILEGSYEPTGGAAVSGKGVSKTSANRLADAVDDFAYELSALFDKLSREPTSGSFLTDLRTRLQNAVSDSFDSSGSTFSTDFGVALDFEATSSKVFEFSVAERRSFVSRIRHQAGSAQELFLGKNPSRHEGLVDKIEDVISWAKSELEAIGSAGLVIDLYA
jgi:hypothetical protein